MSEHCTYSSVSGLMYYDHVCTVCAEYIEVTCTFCMKLMAQIIKSIAVLMVYAFFSDINSLLLIN